MSTGFFLLGAWVLFMTAMRSRLPWTRFSGGLLLLGALAAVTWASLQPTTLRRLAELSPDPLPPLLCGLLAMLAFWWTMHREQESATPKPLVASQAARETGSPRRILWRSASVCLGITAIVGLAWSLPPDLPPELAAGETHAHPWFLAGFAEISAWTGPKIGGILLPIIAIVCLLAAPFLDTREPEINARFRGRSDEVPFFFFAWFFLGLGPILIATWLRPMGWLAPRHPSLVPLSEKVWEHWLGIPSPDLVLIRELPGLLLLLTLFVILPWRLPTWKPTQGAFSRHRRRLGHQYIPAMILVSCIVWIFLAFLFGALWGVGPWLDPSLGHAALGASGS